MPTPEQQVREEIDRQLQAAGWAVQDHRQMNLSAATGVAVRESPLYRLVACRGAAAT
jgi:type I restriction enzyme R subunit